MGKFKVGDRVKTDGGYEFDPNEGTVVGRINTLVTVRLDEIPSGENKAEWSYFPSELLPVATAPVATATGRFKVGDRVRVVKGGRVKGGSHHGASVGEEFTVRRLYDEGVTVDGASWFFYFHEIEPVAVAASNSNFQIREGGYYKTRDGRKVGPMRRWSDTARHRWEADDEELSYIWADDGTEIDSDIDDGADIVAEAEPQTATEILDELEEWIAKQDAARDNGSTAGFTVPVCAYEDEPGWYVTELGRAYADGYAAGLRASLTQAA